MATVNYEEANEARFAEDLKAVAQPAISDTELSQAYKHFGVKKGEASGKTDAELYKKATAGVLSWWNKNKGKGYYNSTKGAGTPLRAGTAKPPTAPAPKFNQGYMLNVRASYGIRSGIPQWAKRNPERFQTWLNMQLRQKGIAR